MKNFDAALQEIQKKYGVFDDRANLFQNYLKVFLEAWEQIPEGEPIAFYGMGEGFVNISKNMDIGSKNVVCIVDNYVDLSFYGEKIPIIAIEDIQKYTFRTVILTGFAARKQMCEDIKKLDSAADIIDIYDILEKRGIVYEVPFFELDHTRLSYRYLERVRQTYQKSSNSEESMKNLKRLIGVYLECRDFVCADRYIQEYQSRRFHQYESFGMLRKELKNLLDEIGKAVQSKKSKNIFVFVLDQLSYSRAIKIDFINEFSKQSLTFTNAFGPGYATRACTFSFLTGKHYVDDGLYKLDEITNESSDFLLEMQVRGVKVRHISPDHLRFVGKLKDCEHYASNAETMPSLYWSLLMHVVKESKKDCIYFIHSLHETHMPFHSGDTPHVLLDYRKMLNQVYEPHTAPPGYFEKMQILVDEAQKYVSDQLELYVGLLDLAKDTVVITADHDDHSIPERFLGVQTTDEMLRVPLIIRSEQVSPGAYAGLYSTTDLPNLLRRLLRGEKALKINKMECIRQEMEPFYNKALRRKAMEDSWYGRITFITDTEKYHFFLNGEEHYCLRADERTNLIDDGRYKERIDWFRRQIQLDTRDLWTFMFGKYPHLLEIHKDRADELMAENKNPNCLSR